MSYTDPDHEIVQSTIPPIAAGIALVAYTVGSPSNFSLISLDTQHMWTSVR